MVVRKKDVRQIKFNLGEIDPLLLPRDDNDGMLGACSRLENYLPLMQGSLERREGLEHIGFIRNKIEPIAFIASNVSAPNGGTVANIIDENTNEFITTGNIGSSAQYVIAEVDFGVSKNISLIDLIDFYLLPNGATGGGDVPTGGGGSGTIWGYGGNNYYGGETP